MRIKKENSKTFILILFSLLLIWVVSEFISTLFFLPVCVLSIYLLKKEKFDYFLLLSLLVICIPNTLVFYINSLVLFVYYLLTIISGKKNKFFQSEILLILVIVVGFVAFLFTQVIETNYLSFFLSLTTFISSFVYFFLCRNAQINTQKFVSYVIVICLIQVLIAYFSYVLPTGFANILFRRNATPDEVRGTFYSANSFGFFCLIAATVISFSIKRNTNRGLIYLVIFIVFLVFAFLADVKSILIGLVGGLVLLVLIRIYIRQSTLKKVVLVLIVSFISIASIKATKNILNPIMPILMTYVDGKNNHKYLYMKRTFEGKGRGWFQYLFGTGPGTCGSRAANSRAYDSMYKKEGSMTLSFLPPMTSPFAEKILVDLYQYEYAINSRWRSALLGNPFNSFTAIFIEFGLVGFLFFMIFHLKVLILALKLESYSTEYKPLTTATFLTISTLSIMGWMDQSYEQPLPMFMLMSLSGVTVSKFYEKK